MPLLDCCGLCGQYIDHASERTISTSDGYTVHLACAERDAARAWRERNRRALLSAIIGSSAVVLSAIFKRADIGFLLLLIVFPIHIWLNNRWWRYHAQVTKRSLIRWW